MSASEIGICPRKLVKENTRYQACVNKLANGLRGEWMKEGTSSIEPLNFSGVRVFRAISEADPEAHSIALLLSFLRPAPF